MGKIRDTGCDSGPNIICLEGNGARPSHKGDGYKIGGGMYTLNSTEVHAVCYEVIAFRKSRRAMSRDDFETWKVTSVADTLNTFDGGGAQEQQR